MIKQDRLRFQKIQLNIKLEGEIGQNKTLKIKENLKKKKSQISVQCIFSF